MVTCLCFGPSCRTRFGVLTMALKAAKHQAFYISNTSGMRWVCISRIIVNHDSTWYISNWPLKTEVTQGYKKKLLNKCPRTSVFFFLSRKKTHRESDTVLIPPTPTPGTLAFRQPQGRDVGRGSHSNSEGVRWQDHGRLCSLAWKTRMEATKRKPQNLFGYPPGD